MSVLSSLLSFSGLIMDIIGFCLIGWNLLKHPDNRPYLGGGKKEFSTERLGFLLVIVGFSLQAISQAMNLG